jgi:hypothetical protein
MTSLAGAQSKYGHVVQSAGGQIFGIEVSASAGVRRQEEKLKIGTPDGFVKIDVVLNQPDMRFCVSEPQASSDILVVPHLRMSSRRWRASLAYWSITQAGAAPGWYAPPAHTRL